MQRYFSDRRVLDSFILGDDDIYHITKVMRMKDDDLIEVVYNKKVYECCLKSVKSDIKIIIKKELENTYDMKPSVALIIPILKEQKVDLILQKATEMGVSKIYLCPMKHCMVKIQGNKKENKINRWVRIVKEASEQSKRIDVPEIIVLEDIKSLEKFIGLNLICSVKEKQKNIKKVLTNNRNCDRINLVIGPEGGLSKIEEDYLVKIGFIPITLGSNVMRVETVPLFLMSIINYEYME